MTPISRRIRGMGLELHVLEWSNDRAPASPETKIAILLHGFQDTAWSWDLVAPSLVEAGYRVFAPDLRGFGASDRVHESGYYYFPDYVFDLTELVDALAADTKIFLVGHSMGGTVATMWAGVFPERIERLALLEGVGPPAFDEDMVIDRTKAWIDGVRKGRTRLSSGGEKPMSFDEAVRRLAIGHPGVRDDIVRRRTEQLTRKLADGQLTWNFDPIHRTRSPIPFALSRWRAHASRITAPTLFVGGGPTGFHPGDEAERIATFASARVEEIADAGHMLHWTRPEEVARLLVAFTRE